MFSVFIAHYLRQVASKLDFSSYCATDVDVVLSIE